MSKTPEERRAYKKLWYAKHRARLLAERKAHRAANLDKERTYFRAYRARNLESLRAAARASKARNKEKIRAASKVYNDNRRKEIKEYYAAHREEKLAYAAQYRLGHLDKVRAYNRVYNKANRAKDLAKTKRRRAQKHASLINDFNDIAQWQEVVQAFDHRCAICGKRAKGKLTRDHITPLVKQGSHTLHNIVPVCKECNQKKGTKQSPVPVQPLLLTLAPAWKKKGS